MITPTPLRVRAFFCRWHRAGICVAVALLLSGVTAARAQSDATNAAPAEAALPVLPSHPLSLHQEPSAADSLEANSAPSASYSLLAGEPDDLPDHLLVVYNSKDSDSRALARYYAERRHIPDERVLGIACSMNEEISRAEYNQTVREPIISYIYNKNWMARRAISVKIHDRPYQLLIATRNNIWAIVLMRGVPLKIAQDNTELSSMQPQPGLQTNAAAVDSELALLPVFGLPLGGFVANPFFDGAATGLVRAGPELATKLILVTRLDGPSAADVRRMIDDTLYAEQHRLAGLAVIDTRGLTDPGNAYTQGDNWLRRARDMLVHEGWSIHFDDNPEVLPPTDPCNHVALYLGWYRDGAYGPWITPPDRFVRGAIAYHLHSGSAATIRNANACWVGPLIAHGAAATMGTVYEPYLGLTPHLDIFTQRLLNGDYFAEAAYASQMGLSWMVTVVGDPLYRPFLVPLPTALANASGPESDHYDWLLLQQVRCQLDSGQIDSTPETLNRYLNIPGPVAQEGLGDILGKSDDPGSVTAAEIAYHEAGSLYQLPIDRIRVGLKLAQMYKAHSQEDEAESELKILLDTYPSDAARFGVVDPLAPVGAPPSSGPPAQLPHPPGPPAPPRPQ